MALLSYKVSRSRQTCGSKNHVTGVIKLNSFGDADSIFCAVRSEHRTAC